MTNQLIPEKKLKHQGVRGIAHCIGGCHIPERASWRTFKPVIDYSKCIKCLMCWLHCPDTAIKLRQDDFPYSEYAECKGCGACAEACPVKCIEMQRNKKDKIQRSDLLQFKKEV